MTTWLYRGKRQARRMIPDRNSRGHRQAGETQEFIQKNYAAAAEAYRLALTNPRRAQQSGEARLALARALSKAGETEEGTRQYRLLVDGPAEARDEQGVGFRFYAAERLLAGGHDADGVRTTLRNQLGGEQRITLPELYLVRALLGSAADRATTERISDRIAEMQQAEALAKDFPRVRAQIETSAVADASVWVPYGPEPWLVTVASPQAPLPGLVIAVSSAKVAPPGIRLLAARRRRGTTLASLSPAYTWNGPTAALETPRARACRWVSGSPLSRWCWGLSCSAATFFCATSIAIRA